MMANLDNVLTIEFIDISQEPLENFATELRETIFFREMLWNKAMTYNYILGILLTYDSN